MEMSQRDFFQKDFLFFMEMSQQSVFQKDFLLVWEVQTNLSQIEVLFVHWKVQSESFSNRIFVWKVIQCFCDPARDL